MKKITLAIFMCLFFSNISYAEEYVGALLYTTKTKEHYALQYLGKLKSNEFGIYFADIYGMESFNFKAKKGSNIDKKIKSLNIPENKDVFCVVDINKNKINDIQLLEVNTFYLNKVKKVKGQEYSVNLCLNKKRDCKDYKFETIDNLVKEKKNVLGKKHKIYHIGDEIKYMEWINK